MPTLNHEGLRTLFLDARTHSAWLDGPVDDALLERLYTLTRLPPTGGDLQPLRVVFVRSPEAKKRLEPALSPGNVAKTMAAPVTAILAWDTAFYEHASTLSPHVEGLRDRLAAMPAPARERSGLISATLQAGYFILAARALGLDCGPMGGFEPANVDATFFADGRWRSIVLVNLGHGDASKLHPRAARLSFAEACRIE
jgi:3-hydroxypropanoate dehydrogenase